MAALLLENAAKAYWIAVDAYCDGVRANMLIPFCDRHKLKFVSGMGSWFFVREYKGNRETRYLNDGDVCKLAGGPRLMRALCDITVDGQSLGLNLQDYPPSKEQTP